MTEAVFDFPEIAKRARLDEGRNQNEVKVIAIRMPETSAPQEPTGRLMDCYAVDLGPSGWAQNNFAQYGLNSMNQQSCLAQINAAGTGQNSMGPDSSAAHSGTAANTAGIVVKNRAPASAP